MRTEEDIEKVIDALFAPEHRDQARQRIASYGDNLRLEPEKWRVRFAILMLSEGDLAKLDEFIAVAKTDYRDVLFWYEYPQESRLDSPEKRQQMRDLFTTLGLEIPPRLKD
jgi:hypothetical protein